MRGSRGGTLGAALTVFSLLYAGTVLSTPLYAAGHTLLRCFVTVAALLVYTPLCLRFFATRVTKKPGMLPKGVSVLLCVSVILIAAEAAADFVRPLSAFADAYGTEWVRLSACAVCVLCGLYAAHKGGNAAAGMAQIGFWLFPLWTLTGLFAFLTTKTAVPLSPPLRGAAFSTWLRAAAETAMPLADVTVAAALTASGKNGGRAVRGTLYGTAAYAVLTGINVCKNLLLLGGDFAGLTDVPNLAAVRLVPLLELPELSVVISMLSAVIRIGIYVWTALRLSAGGGKVAVVLFDAAVVLAAAAAVMCGFGEDAVLVPYAVVTVCTWAAYCGGKRQK